MIKVLHVYVRFHVYMYIYMYMYMCLDFANLFTAVIFSMFFLSGICQEILGLSLCELNNFFKHIHI